MSHMIIISIVGQPSSGKDTFASYLMQKGFMHISTGDILREEMAEKGLPTDRPAMHTYVIAARKARGAGFLAEIAIAAVTQNAVISGLRNVAEVNVLRHAFGNNLLLVALNVPLNLRYARTQDRNRSGDAITLEQFVAEEEAERKGSPDAHQVDDVIAMADVVLDNTGTEKDLIKKIDTLLASIHKARRVA